MNAAFIRGLAGAVAVTVAAISLAGCAADESGSAAEDGEVTITFGTVGSDALVAAEQEIVDAFEAANPDIKVELEQFNFEDYDTKLTTGFRAGEGPDVFRVNHPTVQAWGNAGYLADLTSVLESSGFPKDDFVPGLLQVGQVAGTQYSLPIDTDARVLFYNPRVLASVGVDAPPATWDELIEVTEKFAGGDVYGYGFRSDSDYAMAYEAVGPYIKAAGGEILNTDDPVQAVAGDDDATIAAVELLQEIVETGAVPPGEANMVDTTLNSLFTSDKLAMMTGGPWVREGILQNNPDAELGVDYAVAPIPVQNDGDDSASTSGGWQIAANAKSENIEAAKKFIEFFEQPENLVTLASSNSFPPLKSGLDGDPFAGDAFYDAFKAVLPNSGLPITPVAQMAEVSAVFEEKVRAAVNDGASVEDQLADFDEQVNEAVLR